MPIYIFKCSACENEFDKLLPFNKVKAIHVVDKLVVCPKCKKECYRIMSTGIKAWDAVAQPWEYDYTHKVKPKFVKDSSGHREKFNPSKHSRGRKGSG